MIDPLLFDRPDIAALPISKVLGEIRDTLSTRSAAVLVAPPGAGKTSIVPLALLDSDWLAGRKILMLEPRRLAAMGASARMSSLLGQAPGETVGHRTRFDTKIGKGTRIEVITEGVFQGLLNADPALEAYGAILFDEFHERSLNGDLALALSLDMQQGLREDLRLLPMSATLNAGAVAQLLDAPIIESAGRSFPVEIEYRPLKPRERIEPALADCIVHAVKTHRPRGVLAFLPGQGEILRAARLLEGRLPPEVEIHCLYGSLGQKQQQAAIQPIPKGKTRVILATAIAETSLTIDGVECVIDSGLSRVPVFDIQSGVTRLQTVKSARAAIDQRAGRAGRLGPGRAIRLWNQQQTAALPQQSSAAILNSDLTDLVLDLADWGISHVSQLKWLDTPPQAAIAAATKRLHRLGALHETADGHQITAYGKKLGRLGLPPHLGHMVLQSAQYGKAPAQKAALLALLIQEPFLGGALPDIGERLIRVEADAGPQMRRIYDLAKRIASQALSHVPASLNQASPSAGEMLAIAFPDRIAQQTTTDGEGNTRFRMANGSGAQIEGIHSLANEDFIVIADLAGQARAPRILSAAAISKVEIEERFKDEILDQTSTQFDIKTGSYSSTRCRSFGAVTLSKPQKVPIDASKMPDALCDAIREHGVQLLPWDEEAKQLQGRLEFLSRHAASDGLETKPDVSDAALQQDVFQWLHPFLTGVTSFAAIKPSHLRDALMFRAGNPSAKHLQDSVPSHYVAPSGSRVPVDYCREMPTVSIRPQELFGLQSHPAILQGACPLVIELLSPAGRPIQLTRDIVGFWQGTWSDVRTQYRGRYPKHPWPEDPQNALPTSRVKPRK